MNTYLGIDLGGTKLLIGEVDQNGVLLRSCRYETGYKKQADAVKGLLKAVQDYRDRVGFVGTPAAAGAGVVGIVDSVRGEWISIGHEPEGHPVPLAEMIERELKIPCGIDNDVRSSTIAELLLGKGRYSRNFIYINVGTGLAAGFVVNGNLLRGANVNAGEVGHVVVDLTDAEECVCGRHGCVENVVSGIGFTHQLQKRNRYDLLTQSGGKADVCGMFDRALSGDADCREIMENGARSLSCLIMNLVRVTDPDTVICGGSILGDKRFLSMVKEQLEPSTMRGVHGGVVLSSFAPQYAGVIGAASLGMLQLHPLQAEPAIKLQVETA